MRETFVLTGVQLLAWAGAASRTASRVEEPKFCVTLAEGDFELAQRPPG